VREGRHPWYALSRYGADYIHEFEKPKIIYPDIASHPKFSYDAKTHYYVGNTMFALPIDDLYLLGILNSQVTHYFLDRISVQIRGGYYRFFVQYVEQIPIPALAPAQHNKIAAKARACLDAAQGNAARVTALEGELNALVYQAYGLTDEEISVIEGAVGKSS
jgi:hypothetical protein